MVPLTADRKVYIVRQCRYPYHEILTEIPAGKLDPGETPEECGRRELLEEVGAVAGKMTPLGTLFPTPAYVDEVIHMYLAEELTAAGVDVRIIGDAKEPGLAGAAIREGYLLGRHL